jgi:4-amino-4-deoxy-L-arabinose transferase-like glycosyltransferase
MQTVRAQSQRAPVFGPAFVILIGLALRLVMLGVDVRFHPDEALFAAQARLISARGDVMLRDTDLDKPPLTLYVTALSYRMLGPTEFATRLPNALFSGLSVALVYALALALYGDRVTAALAGLIMALSPFDLAFAATAFTDVQATFWVLLAAWCAVRDRWTAAGLAAALAFAAKSNALIMLPLIVALGIAHNAGENWHGRDIAGRVGRLAGPLALGAALLVGWDMARAPRSFFELGYTRNNPGRLIRSDELWPRAERWLHWLSFISGARVLNVIALAALPVHLARHARTRAAVADWLIVAFGAAFLTWHWLIAFNTYDRYLHSLVPFVILLAARAVRELGLPQTPSPSDSEGEISNEQAPSPARRERRFRREGRLARIALVALVIGMMIPATVMTLRGEARIGGDQGQHTGIDTLATFFNTRLRGEIVYDHWLGWELAYYLGDAPQVIVLYSPMPEALADDMRQQATPRYFVTPSPALAAPWLDALHRADIHTSIVCRDTANGFVIYQLESQSSLFLD